MVQALWRDTTSAQGAPFSSSMATGAWIIGGGDNPAKRWLSLRAAALRGRIACAMRSTPYLDGMGGGRTLMLACVADVSSASLSTCLEVLRSLGIEERLRFRTDAATMLGRSEYLATSDDIEGDGFLDGNASSLQRDYPAGSVLDGGGQYLLVVVDHLRDSQSDHALAVMLDRQTMEREGNPLAMSPARAGVIGMGTWRFSEANLRMFPAPAAIRPGP